MKKAGSFSVAYYVIRVMGPSLCEWCQVRKLILTARSQAEHRAIPSKYITSWHMQNYADTGEIIWKMLPPRGCGYVWLAIFLRERCVKLGVKCAWLFPELRFHAIHTVCLVCWFGWGKERGLLFRYQTPKWNGLKHNYGFSSKFRWVAPRRGWGDDLHPESGSDNQFCRWISLQCSLQSQQLL